MYIVARDDILHLIKYKVLSYSSLYKLTLHIAKTSRNHLIKLYLRQVSSDYIV